MYSEYCIPHSGHTKRPCEQVHSQIKVSSYYGNNDKCVRATNSRKKGFVVGPCVMLQMTSCCMNTSGSRDLMMRMGKRKRNQRQNHERVNLLHGMDHIQKQVLLMLRRHRGTNHACRGLPRPQKQRTRSSKIDLNS